MRKYYRNYIFIKILQLLSINSTVWLYLLELKLINMALVDNSELPNQELQFAACRITASCLFLGNHVN